jgi:hypothetical protein
MKHIQIFEDYSQTSLLGQTTLDQFKSLRRGDKVKYMGGSYIVEEPGEFDVLLRSEDVDGGMIKINYNMFKAKGFIN